MTTLNCANLATCHSIICEPKYNPELVSRTHYRILNDLRWFWDNWLWEKHEVNFEWMHWILPLSWLVCISQLLVPGRQKSHSPQFSISPSTKTHFHTWQMLGLMRFTSVIFLICFLAALEFLHCFWLPFRLISLLWLSLLHRTWFAFIIILEISRAQFSCFFPLQYG